MADITVNQVSTHIQAIIGALATEGQRAQGLVEAKANALIAYKKGRAVRAAIHKADGMAVTLIKHQAEGDASQLEGEMTRTADELKIHFIRMENLRAQLNGWQSINKHLDVVAR